MHLFLIEDLAFSLVGFMLFAVSISTLWWMLHDWDGRHADVVGRDTSERTNFFSLIVPARHEEAVLEETLARLVYLDYPDFEVIVVIGDDDDATGDVAERIALRWPRRVRVVIDDHSPKSKPKALNTALAQCNGDVIGIFDAEDEVSVNLLRSVSATFARTGADVVQSGVQLVDIGTRWFSVRNCLEYFFWYRSRMHAHALHGVMPLGGNTVFFRRWVFDAVGGWDGDCLAEDCEIGIRLSAARCRTAVVYDPHTATREETPPTLLGLFRQRTRWNQGFLQVLRKRTIRSYPTRRQRALAYYLLSFPFIQAASALLVPLSLGAILFMKLPVGVTLAGFLPLTGTVVTTAAEAVALHELCRDFYLRQRLRSYLVLVLSTIPYQLVLSFAAARAVQREFRGVRTWEKTAHVGAHRLSSALAASQAGP